MGYLVERERERHICVLYIYLSLSIFLIYIIYLEENAQDSREKSEIRSSESKIRRAE